MPKTGVSYCILYLLSNEQYMLNANLQGECQPFGTWISILFTLEHSLYKKDTYRRILSDGFRNIF